MKKISAMCLFAVLAGLTGCGRDKKPVQKPRYEPKEIMEMPTEMALNDGFYDEDVDSFVLEQAMDENAFDGQVQDTLAQDDTFYSVGDEQAPAPFKSVYYEFNQYGIKPDQKEVFAYDAQQAKTLIDEGRVVVFEGHACHSAGTPEYNLLLSQRRAAHAAELAAQDYGVDRTAVKVVGRGDTMPQVFGGDRDTQAPNRRLEVYELTTTL